MDHYCDEDEFYDFDYDEYFREIEQFEEDQVDDLVQSNNNNNNNDNVAEILTCPICFEFRKEAIILNCQHTLCAGCAQKLAEPITCPICRSVTTKKWNKLPQKTLPRIDAVLLYTAQKNNVELMKLLLENEGDPNACDFQGKTLLQYAIMHDNAEMVKLLLQHKADPELCDFGDEEMPPLFMACEGKSLEIVRLLLDYDATTDNYKMYEGYAIHAAARKGNVEIVKELVKRDYGLLDVVDDNGNTALHIACSRGDRKLAALLIKLGASLDSRNDNHDKPFDCWENA